mmetsp:Transcript_4737/g.11495  ORF Transcript_4737/g.11495 Transcript_4737/m.11495 type:complete len:256 (+) Transcript_4737:325-1092(+)
MWPIAFRSRHRKRYLVSWRYPAARMPTVNSSSPKWGRGTADKPKVSGARSIARMNPREVSAIFLANCWKDANVQADLQSNSSMVQAPFWSTSRPLQRSLRSPSNLIDLQARKNSLLVTTMLPSSSSRRRQARTMFPYRFLSVFLNKARLSAAARFRLTLAFLRSIPSCGGIPLGLLRPGERQAGWLLSGSSQAISFRVTAPLSFLSSSRNRSFFSCSEWKWNPRASLPALNSSKVKERLPSRSSCSKAFCTPPTL